VRVLHCVRRPRILWAALRPLHAYVWPWLHGLGVTVNWLSAAYCVYCLSQRLPISL
jgi:hypothetical protein